MAAYAALVSVMHVVDNLRLHPRPPISLHKNQVLLLTEKVTFLQEFLEGYNPHLSYTTEADPLEIRIADAAYAAEDAIESHIVDQITSDGEKIYPDALYEALEKVIEEMALIEKEAMEIKQIQHQLHRKSTPPDSLRSSSIAEKSSMVGADDALRQMKDKLISYRSDLQIIPIVGMGGSGKTTLAINIYQDRLIKEHFEISAWATISQEYSILEILIEVLQLNRNAGQSLSEDEFGEILHKHLFGRKYLIIMDDMWSIEAWDEVRRFLPNNQNGSRIVVTTRLSYLASKLPNSNSLEMSLLDEACSWDLLSKTVFGVKGCPLELEEIGKRIGKNCKGLPLSIVVVGGLLAKSKHTREFWEYIEENLNSVVNSKDDDRCLKILHMSYKQLPIYLKPCFLYMGVFPEDHVFIISRLVKLWVAEGFLKPVNGKSLEEIAKEYLTDLIGRNLILVYELGSIGSIKRCKIHDLVRDLCLREAKKERFYTVTPQGIVNGDRRIVISKKGCINALSSMSLARSLIYNLEFGEVQPPSSLRLLRILGSYRFVPEAGAEFLENLHQLVNSRFLCFSIGPVSFEFPSSIYRPFWNLQTLIIANLGDFTAVTDVWYMPHIRHLWFNRLILPDPPVGEDDIVLENLQTLVGIKNFKFSEHVVKRIPNIKKMKIYYHDEADDRYCLSNVDCLDKLESLGCYFRAEINLSGVAINFPHSLKKLSLEISRSQYWQDILDKKFPLLQKLILFGGSFKEGKWETNQAQFPSLKFLHLDVCEGLQIWTTESSHFPCLQCLRLDRLHELKEIPLDFAEISTLRVLEVQRCSKSVVVSAKRILEEQVELYGEEAALQVQVQVKALHEAMQMESLESPNFHVRLFSC